MGAALSMDSVSRDFTYLILSIQTQITGHVWPTVDCPGLREKSLILELMHGRVTGGTQGSSFGKMTGGGGRARVMCVLFLGLCCLPELSSSLLPL